MATAATDTDDRTVELTSIFIAVAGGEAHYLFAGGKDVALKLIRRNLDVELRGVAANA